MRLLLAAIAVVVLVGVWLLSTNESAIEPGGSKTPSVAASGADPRSPASATVIATDAGADRAAVDDVAPAGFTFRVKVVRDDDRTAVEGVELHVAPSEATRGTWPAERRQKKGESLEDFVFREGRVVRSGSDGHAAIGHDERTLVVFAKSGELYAHGVFRVEGERHDGDFELRLVRDVTLVFLLLDEADAPVSGVGVVATFSDAMWLTSFGPSDASGRITVQHAQSRVLGRKGLEVFAHVVGPPGERVSVPFDPVPVEPVIVRVPPCANLEVVALDVSGAPWTFAEGERATVHASTRGSTMGHSAEFDSKGIARLEAVRCGATLTVSSRDLADASLTVKAPDRAGETRRVELRVSAGAPVLRGRLLAPGGDVFRGEFQLQIELPRASDVVLAVSDADGSFRVVSSALRAETTPILHVSATGAGHPSQHLLAAVALSRPLTTGNIDLGDISLAPAPELVRGRVEWSDRSPARGVHLYVSREQGPGNWSTDATDHVDLADDGSFVALGIGDERRCRIQADGGDTAVAVDPIEFAPGARDVVIRLERGATAEATFRVDDDTPWRSFQFILSPALPLPSTRPVQHRITDPEAGRLSSTWSRLPAGGYRMLVELPGAELPIVAIDGIEVVAGLRCADARLRNIDLRGRVQRCELLVVGPDDQPIAEHMLSVRRVGPGRFLRSSLGPGRVEIPLTTPIDIVIEAQGHVPREHRAVAGVATIRLGKAPEYRLRCAAALPPGMRFLVRVHRIDPVTGQPTHRFDMDERPLVFDSQEPLNWSPTPSATYQVELLVGNNRSLVRVEDFEPARIDVHTLIPGQIVEIVPDPTALAAALAKLKE